MTKIEKKALVVKSQTIVVLSRLALADAVGGRGPNTGAACVNSTLCSPTYTC
jgi:hypothetical protein